MRVCYVCVVQQTSRGFEERFAMWSTNLWVSRIYLAFFNVSLFHFVLLFSLPLDCYCCVVAAACCACHNGHRVPVWVSHCVYSQTFLWILLFLFMCAYKVGRKSPFTVSWSTPQHLQCGWQLKTWRIGVLKLKPAGALNLYKTHVTHVSADVIHFID